MTLPTQTFDQFVSNMTASWAASTGQPPVFSSGDVLLALFQALGINLDFLQALVVTVNALTRAQTSTGADLDSWYAQFDFTRLPATYADGQVIFTKLVPAVTPVNIPAGSIIQTLDGTIQYQVVADSNQAAWNAASNAYILQIGQSTLTATVQALTAGSSFNVVANTLVQIGSSIPGIDQVTNPSPIENGVNAESDAAYRARFVLYLATLAQATQSAILAAINGVQQGLLVSLAENTTPQGTTQIGSFTAFVDDGSGNPPNSLLNAVYNAEYDARAFTVQPFVAPPSILAASIGMTIRLASGAQAGTVIVAVQNAVSALTETLTAGATLFVSAIEGAALGVSGVQAVKPGTTINGSGADLTPGIYQEIRSTVAQVTVNTY